jgi:hypothetical protein
MAQALERAADHAKNLAEDVCHLVEGRTMRHRRVGLESDAAQKNTALLGATELLFRRFFLRPDERRNRGFVAPN